ncbi:MAG TPA: hypothetical protein VI248_22225 [Kineosporiaceae bacterium]
MGCSGVGQPRTLPPDRSGNPTDTLSPTGTSPPVTPTPPPTGDEIATPTAPSDLAGSSGPAGSASSAGPTTATGSSATRAPAAPPAPDLPACMIGTWSAPAAREFGNLALDRRSDGTVRSATGVLSVTFTPDHKWTFTYQKVRLQLVAGSVDVDGPMGGTWALAGNSLTSTVGSTAVTLTMHLGGVSLGVVPSTVSELVRALPPNQVFVACTGTGLRFQLPTSQGGGAATFDHA